jgi:hypothetical protein
MPKVKEGKSIRVDPDVYEELILLKHGRMSVSDVIKFLLLQPGIKASTMNDVAVQPQAQVVPITLSDMISGK